MIIRLVLWIWVDDCLWRPSLYVFLGCPSEVQYLGIQGQVQAQEETLNAPLQ